MGRCHDMTGVLSRSDPTVSSPLRTYGIQEAASRVFRLPLLPKSRAFEDTIRIVTAKAIPVHLEPGDRHGHAFQTQDRLRPVDGYRNDRLISFTLLALNLGFSSGFVLDMAPVVEHRLSHRYPRHPAGRPAPQVQIDRVVR